LRGSFGTTDRKEKGQFSGLSRPWPRMVGTRKGRTTEISLEVTREIQAKDNKAGKLSGRIECLNRSMWTCGREREAGKIEKSFYHVDWEGKTWDHVTTLKFTTILKERKISSGPTNTLSVWARHRIQWLGEFVVYLWLLSLQLK